MRNLAALTFIALITTLCSDRAVSAPSIAPVDPLKLHCRLRATQFVSEISFKRDAEGEIEGELDNYAFTSENKLRFISGNVFFDVQARDNGVFGHTGDRRGVISNFSLTVVNASNGTWAYEQMEPSGEKSHARFSCTLSSTPKNNR